MYLGATARQCGWHVEAIDTYLINDVERAIGESVQRHRPRMIALTGLTAESKSIHRFARAARQAVPEAVILAGGPHPSAYPSETLEDACLDGIAIGEGERTLEEILGKIERGESWR